MSFTPKLRGRRELQARQKPIYRTPWSIMFGICLVLASVSSLLLLKTDMPPCILRNAWLSVTWALWFLTAAAFPIMSVQAGVVPTESSPVYRASWPVRFWAALVVMSLFHLTLLGCFSLAMRAMWFEG